ncbi:MAG: UDP-N-acetylmuramoyl-L-alanyl-D-glutamate--2,6-diaminopimelate ligase [Nitriliruptorales bacterium]|nr:UDP-N-acetylmuramoyl-L-alanyl-D-glutamate--2,6-diaminopimelate ligase [Nitriliruptorales bacterium]
MPSTVTTSAPAVPIPLRDVATACGPRADLSSADAGTTLVTDVTHDSRQVTAGMLFACRPGQRSDGHDHAPAAVGAGAAALLVERFLDLPVPQVRVPSVAQVMGPAAAAVHNDPSSELLLLGVTGTNGKTTTAYLLESVLAAAGHVTGLVGTIETRVAGTPIPGVRTTPEATDLQRLLRRMRDAGVTGAAMEVSSHGLSLGRVRATRFRAAVFTNLSLEHLDFHADMEDYFAAKRSLFDAAYTPVGIVNTDDPYGERLASEAAVEVVRVSARGVPAHARATAVEADAEGSVFTARLRTGSVRVRVELPGMFNVANALLAVAAADAVGIQPDAAAAGIAACRGVPGRMERVDAGQPFTVLVDYAHTPEALANVLRSVREVSSGRIVVVIGCGGDRDPGKRPLMGRVAAELSDAAVLTSDNPRSEDPQAILDAMIAGAAEVPGARWRAELDRRAAIGLALDTAQPGDVVVVAGKGHEATQELRDRVVPFDDRAIVRELLGAAA